MGNVLSKPCAPSGPDAIEAIPQEHDSLARITGPLSAANRTFAISEILVHILLQLDEAGPGVSNFSTAIEDLFVFQRVSRRWQANIKDSLQLRRIMLLEYDEEPIDRPYGMRYLLDRDAKGLNFHPLLPCIEVEGDITDHWTKRAETFVRLGVEWDPTNAALHEESYLFRATVRCYGDNWQADHPVDENNEEKPAPRRYLSSIDASWRRMKLLSRSKHLRVDLCTLLDLDPWKRSHKTPPLYSVTMRFGPGPEVLGHLYDRLDYVLLRSWEEHTKVQEKFQDLRSVLREGGEASDDEDTAVVQQYQRLIEDHADPRACTGVDGECLFCAAWEHV